MERAELYKKTVDILFDAYFNDTLEHANCYACAVGNIVAANRGLKYLNKEMVSLELYGDVIYTGRGKLFYSSENSFTENLVSYLPGVFDSFRANQLPGLALQHLESTGYSFDELTAIENAFEGEAISAEFLTDDIMFSGLVAVLEELKQIHKVGDNEPEIARFRNHYKTKIQPCF